MQVFKTIQAMQDQSADWRRAGLSIGFVPTMGNLHAGHLNLCQAAIEQCDRVIVSIYVNPLQFGENEDFDAYPRTFDDDCRKLTKIGVYGVFAPTDAIMYPEGKAESTRVVAPAELTSMLCGQSRPGHFDGVTTVVMKLFNAVQPDKAYFGEKDYQQLQIIRKMAQDMFLTLQVRGLPTVREADGLALSSRNQYLTGTERQIAPQLYKTLQAAAEQLKNGAGDYTKVESEASYQLRAAGFRPEYVSIRRTGDLKPALPGDDKNLVILAAARLGQTRLIDNLPLTLNP
jgi:pantoate--beta-alanine ligase